LTLARSTFGLALLLIALGITQSSLKASGGAESAPFLYTSAKVYEPLAWMHGADRFPSGANIFIYDAGERHALLADFVASADPAISFDGQRVLFAGKRKPQDTWQIWEVPLSGGDARAITSAKEDCIRPFYLPDDRIVYARRSDGRFRIEASDLNGRDVLPLTYGPASFLATDILRDGRILFEAAFPFGSDAAPEIYAVYSDGSGVESYRCDHGKVHHQGKQISSGDIVFASARGLSRFTSARAREVGISSPPGQYAGDVTELSSGEWLLPWRASSKSPFQLVIWHPGSSAIRSIVAAPDRNAVQPTALGSQIVPNRHPSGLHDWPNANLLCLNAYTSKYSFAAGSIHSVRFYARDSSGNVKLLGTAPVESDGSFFVHVPTEQALQIELLDASDKSLKRESGFFWMRRGEQRVCVGCHAGPETAPENAVPMILIKSTTPTDLTGPANASGGN